MYMATAKPIAFHQKMAADTQPADHPPLYRCYHTHCWNLEKRALELYLDTNITCHKAPKK
jgi:hypothetical protein